MYKKEILEEVKTDIQIGRLTLTDEIQVLKLGSSIYDYYYKEEYIKSELENNKEFREIYNSIKEHLIVMTTSDLITMIDRF